MALINPDRQVHFFTREPGHGGVLWEPIEVETNYNPAIIVNRPFSDADYYVFEFREGAVWGDVPIEEYIPENFLQRLQSGDPTAKLILSNSHEGFMGVLPYIYDGVAIKYNIN